MNQTIQGLNERPQEDLELREETVLQLVYASAASVEFDEGDLIELLRRARRNNEELGVTGMLLFHEGSFIQVLEGPPDVVEALYDEIMRDPRHGDHTLIYRCEQSERCFASWSMGFEHVLSRCDMPRGLSRFLRHGILSVSEEDGDLVRRALVGFRDGRFRRA